MSRKCPCGCGQKGNPNNVNLTRFFCEDYKNFIKRVISNTSNGSDHIEPIDYTLLNDLTSKLVRDFNRSVEGYLVKNPNRLTWKTDLVKELLKDCQVSDLTKVLVYRQVLSKIP